jgi:hypothetical protein
MKKIISLIILVVMMIWTWNMIHGTPDVTFETHSIIQMKLAEIIQASVQKHRPTAQNFNIVRLWTETVNPEKVKAYFTYKFNDSSAGSSAEQTVTGEAFLTKTSGENSNQENWKVEKVQTNANQVIFDEGTTISPDASADEEPTPAASPTPPPAEKHGH